MRKKSNTYRVPSQHGIRRHPPFDVGDNSLGVCKVISKTNLDIDAELLADLKHLIDLRDIGPGRVGVDALWWWVGKDRKLVCVMNMR